MMRLTVGIIIALLAVHLGCGDAAATGPGEGSGGFITGAGGSVSSAATTNATSGSTGGQTASTTSGGGEGGAGATSGNPPICNDIGLGEPNEFLAVSWQLPGINDCDSSESSVSGTIAGSADVDWFTFEGDDSFCVEDPTRSFTQSESGLRVCKYVHCFSGEVEFVCPSGTTSDSVDGYVGCCGTSGFVIDPLNCKGTIDEHITVFIRVDQPGATEGTCNDYVLSYHY